MESSVRYAAPFVETQLCADQALHQFTVFRRHDLMAIDQQLRNDTGGSPTGWMDFVSCCQEASATALLDVQSDPHITGYWPGLEQVIMRIRFVCVGGNNDPTGATKN